MSDLSSERALLEHIAQHPTWAHKNATKLSPALFGREANRLIFEAICDHDKWDLMSICQSLGQQGKLEKAGGPAAVSELFIASTVESMADWHLTRSMEDAVLRRCHAAMQDGLEQITRAIDVGTENAESLISQIQERVTASSRLPGRRLERQTMAQALETVINDIEERSKSGDSIPGITTGFTLLDKLTMGLQEGHLWVFAGLPGKGKSTLMQNVAEAAMAAGAKLGVYQLEMPIQEQAFRFLCSDSMVDSQMLSMATLSRSDAEEVEKSVKRLSKLGAEFPETSGVDADGLLADIAQSDYRIVMLDYLQLLEINQAKGESREQAISTVARKLKTLAKNTGKTILTGSQVNDDGKLRESRAIGQHADKVLYICAGDDESENPEGERILHISKNRGGPAGGKIKMRFMGANYRFATLEQE